MVLRYKGITLGLNSVPLFIDMLSCALYHNEGFRQSVVFSTYVLTPFNIQIIKIIRTLEFQVTKAVNCGEKIVEKTLIENRPTIQIPPPLFRKDSSIQHKKHLVRVT